MTDRRRRTKVLTEQQIQRIRELRRLGEFPRDLAKLFGTSAFHILCVLPKPPTQMTPGQREIYRKLQGKAHGALHQAIRKGKIVDLKKATVPCMDCRIRRADTYDHRDYSKPFDVDPVCQTCNRLRGPARIPR